MCGIQFCLSRSSDRPAIWDDLAKHNVKRGPDSQNIHQIQVNDTFMTFYSTVLHLRGRNNVAQPVCTPGWVLCWNGEIFDGLEIRPEENDTWKLMEAISCTPEGVVDVMSRIEGPFAFVLWNEKEQTLLFGRDCLGRRSLMWRQTEDAFMLSSVGLAEPGAEWQEVPATGFFYIKFGETVKEPAFTACGYPVQLIPWVYDSKADENSMLMPFSKINTAIPTSLPDKFEDEELALKAENEAVEVFEKVLDDAVRRRVADIPYLDANHSIARVAILFSGGLDCICLAALANRHLPISEPIDLLNVAFDNPRAAAASGKQNVFDTPDRITGRDGVAELRRIAPDRVWNFVEINVPFQEATEHRQEIIERMYPLDTVMDLSIAMALWFAARGKGIIEKNGKKEPYESHARVLLSGLGADEQLGGYSRHREAYRHGSWERLIQETQLDVDRIWTRNLGRDDRIISDHGKEARFPYLCTRVVKHLCQLQINVKMDMRYGRGVGEKLLLRQVARRLGLLQACRNWKRAIQFGAKTAKMTNSAERGQHKLAQSSSSP